MADIEKKKTYDPEEKVERMNRVFDQVVLPAVIFTVVMFVITSLMLNPSCKGKTEETPSQSQSYQELDPYIMREVLLEDMEKNRSIFERGGYSIVQTEQSGVVACFTPDAQTQIFDNISDGSGSRYSAVIRETDGLSITIRIYSDKIFLVEITDGEQAHSAIFRDDRFGTWTSASDAEAESILGVVSSEQLVDMIEVYKAKIVSLVNAGN